MKLKLVTSTLLPTPFAEFRLHGFEAPNGKEHVALTLGDVSSDEPVLAMLERLGHMPLPPYIGRPDDEADREHWFFRVWCVKEAILKAHGQGISFGLHRLQLAPGADGALHLRWCDPELGEAARWHLHEWQASGQFRAALAWYPH